MAPPTMKRTALACCIGFALLSSAPVFADPVDDAPPPSNDAEPATKLKDVVVTAVPLGQSADQIVTPVSVLAGTELDDARSGTIGQTVAGVPGVQTTAFGAGAGRPVIRGLDGSRVAVLADGLGSADVSNVSQDHATTVEPFLADQIEILKGPATLLYGSGAIGGIVNLVDGRIPQSAPANGLSGRTQIGYDSVSGGGTGMFRVDAGGDGFALHADGLYRHDGDYDIPGRTLDNSFAHSKSGALGGSWLGDWGYLGLSVSRYLSNYGNPAEPGDPAEGEPAVRVSMGQTRYDLKGALNAPFAGIDKAEFSFGHSDYQHVEYEGSKAGTTFTNQTDEGRVQLTHAPLAGWTGAFGLQAFHRDFAAIGEESFVPPTSTKGVGLFVTEQREFGPLKVELGARTDRQSSTPDNGDKRDFSPLSLSAGFAWRFDDAWHMTLNLDRAQRAPAEEELFSHGPHAASATFEIGDANLAKETANQVELGLHYHSEFVEAKVAAYYNRYDDFIYLADTGEIEDDLPVRQWSQRNAKFRGGEAEATFHLAKNASGHYDLRVWGDTVRATLAGGGNLPRIPAARFGSELSWRNDDWRASLGATRYFEQDDVAEFETDTKGFTLVNARLAWSFFNNDRSSWEAFVNADNLTNQTARLSTSLIKDQAPLAGRNFAIGVRGMF
ncbi:TonB-dependent receptor [Dokdonella sp.]|uniref:TonB-dependent receptor n=1 Tax=Dokdonella sp. TaxID=2291710 RepID=UPI001B28EFE9|nr:TonB-dependent receptor [Dokdonella sp.]MBO9662809.1 TonB-dependent receptor [Dokdonella sp.]